MSLSKRCFRTILIQVVVVAAVLRFDAPTKEPVRPRPGAKPDALAVAPDEWLSYTARPANNLIQPDSAFEARGEIPSNIFPVQSQNPKNLSAGKLLVASRDLVDPNFAKTVILLVHCDSDGVVGLILNRRTNVPLSRVLEQLKAAKDRSDPVYLGGPVETPAVFALLRSTAKLDAAEQILGNVYFISAKASFEKAISDQPSPGIFHVYLGYAGWSNEQLRMEVALGSWFIFQGDARKIFDSDPDSLWLEMIQETELQSVRSEPADALSQKLIPAVLN